MTNEKSLLESLFEKALSSGSPEDVINFYEQFFNTEIIVLTKAENSSDLFLIGTAENMDQPLVPMFTSEAAANKMRQTLGLPESSLTFPLKINPFVLFKSVPTAEFVLNPCSDFEKTFSKEEVSNLLESSSARQVLVGPVKSLAPSQVLALKGFCTQAKVAYAKIFEIFELSDPKSEPIPTGQYIVNCKADASCVQALIALSAKGLTPEIFASIKFEQADPSVQDESPEFCRLV